MMEDIVLNLELFYAMLLRYKKEFNIRGLLKYMRTLHNRPTDI
jgi:hypothetical protein